MLINIETLQQLRQGSASIIYFSRYRADQVDNGGARRVAQLRQLLELYDVEFVSSLGKSEPAAKGQAQASKGVFNQVIEGIVRGRTRKYSAEFGRWLFFSDRLARRWVRALQGRQKPRLVLVDDPIFFPSLIRFCCEQGIPVIALCQNIETLSRGQIVPCYQLELLAHELALLGKCRAVVTISVEEAFLLRNLGQTVIHLPYYPPVAVVKQLLAVRQRRATSTKRDFLLMGSAGNPPTRAGMARFLSIWRELGGLPGDRLLVAGYGTEVLRELAGTAGIECLGSVTDEVLVDLLGLVRAGIVYQEEGAGALTRIGEYLLAGVPVMANHHAARSWHHLAGVSAFAEPADILPLLTNFQSNDVEVQLPPQADPTPLLQLINAVVSGD